MSAVNGEHTVAHIWCPDCGLHLTKVDRNTDICIEHLHKLRPAEVESWQIMILMLMMDFCIV